MTDAPPFRGFICQVCNNAQPLQAHALRGSQAPSCDECGGPMTFRETGGRGSRRPQRRTQTYRR